MVHVNERARIALLLPLLDCSAANLIALRAKARVVDPDNRLHVLLGHNNTFRKSRTRGWRILSLRRCIPISWIRLVSQKRPVLDIGRVPFILVILKVVLRTDKGCLWLQANKLRLCGAGIIVSTLWVRPEPDNAMPDDLCSNTDLFANYRHNGNKPSRPILRFAYEFHRIHHSPFYLMPCFLNYLAALGLHAGNVITISVGQILVAAVRHFH